MQGDERKGRVRTGRAGRVTNVRARRTYYHARQAPTRRGGLLVHLGAIRKRVENVRGVIRTSTCYPSVLVRMSTMSGTLGSFGGLLLTSRVQNYISSSVHRKQSKGISRLYAVLRGLVGWFFSEG